MLSQNLLAALAPCYAASLARNPGLAVRLQIRFVIGSNGLVSGVDTVEVTRVADNRLLDCIDKALANLTYPQPEDGSVTVEFPLQLRPRRARAIEPQ